MKLETINHDTLQALLERKVAEVLGEPAFDWRNGFQAHRTDKKGEPVVRVAVTNCRLDMDIWEGLRNPANVGLYPLTFPDIWKHYAAANIKNTRPYGNLQPLAMPESFEDASRRFKRALIVSGMLAINPDVFETYAEKIEDGDLDPFDYYQRAARDVEAIIEKGINKVGLQLVAPERAVIPMTKKMTAHIIERTRAEYMNGRYHGPCNNHWPQNSIAVMTGLLRFGVNHIPFRDEVVANGKRQRLFGRYRSIVIFDGEEPVTDGTGGVTLLDRDRLAWMRRVADYTDTDPDVAAERYCSYNTTNHDGGSICSKCLDVCPSGALLNSLPQPDGRFEKAVTDQHERFWDGKLDFDYRTCCRDRHRAEMLFDDYLCARCEAICAAEGQTKSRSEVRAINAKV